jgi:ribosome-associated translation inhibitor RaiA
MERGPRIVLISRGRSPSADMTSQKEQGNHFILNERATMRIVSAFLLLSGASAFTSPMACHANTALSMVSSSSIDRVPITITGNNIDVTEALADYVNKKLERPLGKLRSNGLIRDCDVHLSVTKNPRVRMLVESGYFILFVSSKIFQSSHRTRCYVDTYVKDVRCLHSPFSNCITFSLPLRPAGQVCPQN